MAYINGIEILFSAKVNGSGGDNGGYTFNDVWVDGSSVKVSGGMSNGLEYKLTDGTISSDIRVALTNSDAIIPSNIKKDVTILGVTGEYEGEATSGGISLADVEVSNVAVNTAVAGGVTGVGKGAVLRVTLTDGEETRNEDYFMSTDPITKDVIKSGVNILGVTGEYEGEGITPTGTKTITSNGTHDVTNFASVSVNVPTSGGGTSEVSLPNEYCYIDPASTSGPHTYEFTGALTNCSYTEIANNGGISGDYAGASKKLVISKGVISDTFETLGAGWQGTNFNDVIVPTNRTFIIWSKSSTTAPSGNGLTVEQANFGTRTMNGTTYYGYLCIVASGTKNIILW